MCIQGPGCSQTALVNQGGKQTRVRESGPQSRLHLGGRACAWSRIRSFSTLYLCSSLASSLPRSPLTDQGGEGSREPENLGSLLSIISAQEEMLKKRWLSRAAGQHWALTAALQQDGLSPG